MMGFSQKYDLQALVMPECTSCQTRRSRTPPLFGSELSRRNGDAGVNAVSRSPCVATCTRDTASAMSMSGKETRTMKSVQGAIVKETKRMHNTGGVQNAPGPVAAERTSCPPSGAGRIECIMMILI